MKSGEDGDSTYSGMVRPKTLISVIASSHTGEVSEQYALKKRSQAFDASNVASTCATAPVASEVVSETGSLLSTVRSRLVRRGVEHLSIKESL